MMRRTVREYVLPWIWAPTNFALVIAWILVAVLFVCKLRHIACLFPILIFAWLLALFAWLGVSKRRWSIFLGAPVMAALVCLPLAYVYGTYEMRGAERALNEFIQYVVEEDSSLEFSSHSHHMPALSAFSNDFTVDYTILGRDRFYQEHEWTVKFATGSVYHIVMAQVSPGHWSVNASNVRPEP